jgi:hypothetical protein
MKLIANTTATIYGTTNSWSLAPQSEQSTEGCNCDVGLEIQGDEEQGFHLVMSPVGFLTADNWYKSMDEAAAAASELFEIAQDKWSVKQHEQKRG